MSPRRLARPLLVAALSFPQLLPAQRQADALRGLPGRARIRFVTTDRVRHEGELRRVRGEPMIELDDGRRRPIVAVALLNAVHTETGAPIVAPALVGAFVGGSFGLALGSAWGANNPAWVLVTP